jgi:Ca-activated chloride channel family protein
MRFLQPDAASWLIAVPLALCVLYLHAHAKRRFRRRASIGSHLPPISRLSTWWRDVTGVVAAVVAVLLLVAALARPQMLLDLRTPEYEKEDLVLVLDRSISMHAQDVRPTRFARAINEIKTFLSQKPDSIDRIALVGFAGTSLVLTPFTQDISNLYFYLDWIGQDLEPHFGTDIGNALANARELVRKDGRPTRKLFIIVSDGDDHGPELPRQLAALRSEEIPVYTIGIGGEGPVSIPVVGPDGRSTLLLDEENRPVTTRFSETTLRRIATLTSGRYVRSLTGTELAPAIHAAVNRERKVVGWNRTVEYRDLYRECLAGAGLAILLLFLAL